MLIHEYQAWLESWDRSRGWDRVSLSHTLLHAYEEMGEVSRLILQWEGYKPSGAPARWRDDLAEELADTFVFLFKLASQAGVDVEAALVRSQTKADNRHADLDAAGAELARYHARQAEELARITGSDERFK